MASKEVQLQWFISFAVKNEIMQNKELAEKLCKTSIRKFEKWKVRLSFIGNICG